MKNSNTFFPHFFDFFNLFCFEYFIIKNFMKNVNIAVILVAGMGTRVGMPGEHLPKPLIDGGRGMSVLAEIVLDGLNAGINKFVIVARPEHIKQIELDVAPTENDKARIFNSKRAQYLGDYSRIWSEANIIIVPQTEGKVGDLPALMSASPYIYDQNAVVVFGDGLFEKNAILQALEGFSTSPLVVLSTVEKEKVSSFGIAKYKKNENSNNVLSIEGFIEKPQIKDAPSSEAAVGVYVVTPDLMANAYKVEAGKDGEYRLADLIAFHLKNGGKIDGKILDGWWGDTGNLVNLATTRLLTALADKNIAPEIMKIVKKLQK